MHAIRAENCRRMKWKNGGGETIEIAVSPEGAGLDDFDWRVSMARVEASGPFSLFAGVDRTLAILDGKGIVLTVEGRIPFGLTRRSEPLTFPADVATSATLIAGPITDLNVMTRRGRLEHRVTRLRIEGPQEIALDANKTLLFCHSGAVLARLGPDEARLGPLDTLVFDRASTPLHLEPDAAAEILLIVIGERH